jgi:hypothetical protein
MFDGWMFADGVNAPLESRNEFSPNKVDLIAVPKTPSVFYAQT